MSTALSEYLGLPTVALARRTLEAEGFGQAFRQRAAVLNERLRTVAAYADAGAHEALAAQRTRLYRAYQTATQLVAASTDAAEALRVTQRVLASVDVLERKAASLVHDAAAARLAWMQRQSDFDDAMLQIGELEAQRHPKAAALRKLGDAIRVRANARRFRESASVHEQLRRKLDEIRDAISECECARLAARLSRTQELAGLRRRLQAVLDKLGA